MEVSWRRPRASKQGSEGDAVTFRRHQSALSYLIIVLPFQGDLSDAPLAFSAARCPRIVHAHPLAVHVPVDSDNDMPRRPRPTSRRPPQNAIISPVKAIPTPPVSRGKSASGPKLRRKPHPEEAEPDESSADSDSEGFGPSGAGASRSESEEDGLGEDALDADDGAEPDAPRVAQWVDDEELDEVSEEESESSEDEEAHKSRLVRHSQCVPALFVWTVLSFSKQASSRYPSVLCGRHKRL